MVETMLPVYREAQAALGMDIGGMDPTHKLIVAKAKIGAAAVMTYLGPVLFPGDD